MGDTPKVPQWVTSWPEWFGVFGNVTVVPKDDYDKVVAELARVDGYDRYCDGEIKKLERDLATAREEGKRIGRVEGMREVAINYFAADKPVFEKWLDAQLAAAELERKP